MPEPRFVELLTKELTEGLSSAEKQEHDVLLQQNPLHKRQSAIIKEYWNSNKTQYKATAANFNKLMDVIRDAEQSVNVDSEADDADRRFKLWSVLKYAAAILIFGAAVYSWYLLVGYEKQDPIAAHWQNNTTSPRVKRRLILS